MPLKPSDQIIPGSKRAYEQVNNRLMREIVRDFAHGPASLPCIPTRKPLAEAAGPTNQPSSRRAGSN